MVVKKFFSECVFCIRVGGAYQFLNFLSTKKAALLGEDGEILNSNLRKELFCIKAYLAQINTNCGAICRELRIIASFAKDKGYLV